MTGPFGASAAETERSLPKLLEILGWFLLSLLVSLATRWFIRGELGGRDLISSLVISVVVVAGLLSGRLLRHWPRHA